MPTWLDRGLPPARRSRWTLSCLSDTPTSPSLGSSWRKGRHRCTGSPRWRGRWTRSVPTTRVSRQLRASRYNCVFSLRSTVTLKSASICSHIDWDQPTSSLATREGFFFVCLFFGTIHNIKYKDVKTFVTTVILTKMSRCYYLFNCCVI